MRYSALVSATPVNKMNVTYLDMLLGIKKIRTEFEYSVQILGMGSNWANKQDSRQTYTHS